jgi:4-hydroxybenzoate polyprenyltransferase
MNALADPGSLVPVCVDLDRTLVKTDLHWEAALIAIKRSPWVLLLLPLWLLRGKACLMKNLAARADIDAGTLPYSEELLAYLRQQKNYGRSLVLISGCPPRFSRAVAEHVGIFNEVISHSERPDRRGRNLELTARYGIGGFDYAGARDSDQEIWRLARRAIVVHARRGLAGKIGRTHGNPVVIAPRAFNLRTFAAAIRLNQWIKNILVFVPVIAGHKMLAAPVVKSSAIAFFVFGLAASSNYVFNDLLDLAADRKHPRKRLRPLAAGDVSAPQGLALALLLLAGSMLLASRLPGKFTGWLVLYLAIAWAYSLGIKQQALLDVVALACLYTLRVVAGGAATGIRLSYWLLAFSLFIFSSLALVKRCSELTAAAFANAARVSGRDYRVADLGKLRVMGIASGYVAALVIALYVNSPETAVLYSRPMMLWLLCPLTLFWVSRIWIAAGRGEIEEDPVAYALRDGGSRLVVLVSLLTLLAAL